MFTLKNVPQNKQQILAASLRLFLHSFKSWLPFSLLCAICFTIPQFYFLAPLQEWQSLQELPWVAIICWLIALTLMAGMVFRLFCFCYHIPSNFLISLRHALFKIIPVLMQGALYALLVLGATMMLIIPGIIFTFSLLFSFILVITGNQNVLQTLISSHRLVWQHWWHTFFVMSFTFLLPIIVFLISFVGITALTYTSLSSPAFYWLFSLTNIFLQAFLLPFSISTALVLLHDLRQRTTELPRW